MKRIVSLIAVMAVPALLLFGCGGGYETSSGFVGTEVNVSGLYMVASKDPGIMPNLYSIQLTHSGKSLQGLDNLGRAWTGTLSNFSLYGVYPAGQAAADQQQQQQQPQQQQQQLPESFHAEIYLTTPSGRGINSLTGVMDTNVQLTFDTGNGQQQQQTTGRYTTISGTIIDSAGNSGYIGLYNSIGYEDTNQTTP